MGCVMEKELELSCSAPADRGRSPRLLALGWLLAAAGGCLTPSYVEEADVERALAMGQLRTVCRGLDMENPDTRTYTTTKFHAVEDPIAAQCVCDHILRDGKWDAAVAEGLKGSRRDDMADCLAAVLESPQLDREVELVAALVNTGAPGVRPLLLAHAKKTSDATARAAAVRAQVGTTDPGDLDWLLHLLRDDSAPEVRAAAATALSGQEGEEIEAALRAAFRSDDDGEVRLKALEMLRRLKVEDRDALICGAIMEDTDPEVRKAGLELYKGTKREVAVECLRKRAFGVEEDGQVREKLLEILKSSSHKGAADILCDAIPFFLENYVVDDIPQEIPGTLITFAQNDRDWRRSLECAQKAYGQRHRYDCYGKQHIANWVKELGGSAFAPKCAKTDGTTAVYKQAAGGQGIMSFE